MASRPRRVPAAAWLRTAFIVYAVLSVTPEANDSAAAWLRNSFPFRDGDAFRISLFGQDQVFDGQFGNYLVPIWRTFCQGNYAHPTWQSGSFYFSEMASLHSLAFINTVRGNGGPARIRTLVQWYLGFYDFDRAPYFTLAQGSSAGSFVLRVLDTGKASKSPNGLVSYGGHFVGRTRRSLGVVGLVELKPETDFQQDLFLERTGKNRFQIRLESGEYLTSSRSPNSHLDDIVFRNISTAETSFDDVTQWEFEQKFKLSQEKFSSIGFYVVHIFGIAALFFYALVLSLYSQCWCGRISSRLSHLWSAVAALLQQHDSHDEEACIVHDLLAHRRIRFAQSAIRGSLPWMVAILCLLLWMFQDTGELQHIDTLTAGTFLFTCPLVCAFTFLTWRPERLTVRVIRIFHIYVALVANVVVCFENHPQGGDDEFLFRITLARVAFCIMFGLPGWGIPCFMLGSVVNTLLDWRIGACRTGCDATVDPGVRNRVINEIVIVAAVSTVALAFDRSFRREAQTYVELLRSRHGEGIVSSLLECMCDGYVHIDSSLTITKSTTRLAAMLQRQTHSRAPLQGVSFADLVHSDAREQYTDHMDRQTSEGALSHSMLNTDLCDSVGNKVPVILYIATLLDVTGKKLCHLIGVSEQGEGEAPQQTISVVDEVDSSPSDSVGNTPGRASESERRGSRRACSALANPQGLEIKENLTIATASGAIASGSADQTGPSSISDTLSSSSNGSESADGRTLNVTEDLNILTPSAGFLKLFGNPLNFSGMLSSQDAKDIKDWVAAGRREAFLQDQSVDGLSPPITLVVQRSKNRRAVYKVTLKGNFCVPRLSHTYAVAARVVACERVNTKRGTPRNGDVNTLGPLLTARIRSSSSTLSL